MALRNPVGIGRREGRQVRLFVMEKVSWATECSVKRTFVSYPGQTAVFPELFLMKRQNFGTGEPNRFLHFDSSRNVLRYFLAPTW